MAEERFNLENTDTIDGLAYEDGALIMMLADGMPWDNEQRHYQLLKAKLNTYILFIESQQYREKYPDVKKIKIYINTYFKKPEYVDTMFGYFHGIVKQIFADTEVYVESRDIAP